MQLIDTPDQSDLRAILRNALAQYPPRATPVGADDVTTDFDGDLWQMIAREMGLAGLLVPERFGGAGASAAEVAVVLSELGRVLARVPYLASAVLAVTAIVGAGDEPAMAHLLPGIADGRRIATVAGATEDGSWRAGARDVVATPDKDGWRLFGTKSYVIDGAGADVVLVFGRAPAGPTLFAVERESSGVALRDLPTMDRTRPLARLDLDAAEARRVGVPGGGAMIRDRVLRAASLGLAAEQLGGLEHTLEMAVDHARTRIQFGVPIGTFQGVKHRCADLLVAVETARSLVAYAAWCAGTEDADLPVAAAMARAYCSDAFFHAAGSNIQVHGGIGFTWEHPAHLYLKRAASSRALFGTPTAHRAELAELLHL